MRVMAARDPVIQDLLEHGYEYVTNAFRRGAVPRGIRAREAEVMRSRLHREGYRTAVASAYDEAGNHIPGMVSIWQKREAV